MDSISFDRLARRVATSSRRHLLRLSIGAAFGPLFAPARLGRAQSGGLADVGGSCAMTAECRQAEMQMGAVCAANGFTSDGERNCCLERGCCRSDADCCGDLRCAPTGDVCSVCRRPPFPTRVVGQVCLSDQDCLAAPAVDIACIDGRCTCLGPTDRCSLFGSRPAIPDVPEAESALAVADQLSRLEVDGQFNALYDRLHPDAQQVIPREAVLGWYTENVSPLAPEPARAVKVRFVAWTWEVTGQTYPDTAEVAFRQRLTDGTVIADEVRLVQDGQGNWNWFFGRDRAFVDTQIERFREKLEPR